MRSFGLTVIRLSAGELRTDTEPATIGGVIRYQRSDKPAQAAVAECPVVVFTHLGWRSKRFTPSVLAPVLKYRQLD